MRISRSSFFCCSAIAFALTSREAALREAPFSFDNEFSLLTTPSAACNSASARTKFERLFFGYNKISIVEFVATKMFD